MPRDRDMNHADRCLMMGKAASPGSLTCTVEDFAIVVGTKDRNRFRHFENMPSCMRPPCSIAVVEASGQAPGHASRENQDRCQGLKRDG